MYVCNVCSSDLVYCNVYASVQPYTNPGVPLVPVSELITVTPKYLWVPSKTLAACHLLVPRILRWLLDFWKTGAPLT